MVQTNYHVSSADLADSINFHDFAASYQVGGLFSKQKSEED